MLFQCVNLHSIGVYNCEGNSIAGVVCLNTNSLHNATSSSNTTETPIVAGLSNTYIAILSGSLGLAVLVIIGISIIVSIAIIVYIQRMKIKR